MDDTTRFCVAVAIFLVHFGSVSSNSCNSYCDEEGYFQNGFDCQEGLHCCGDAHERYCCNNTSLDASFRHPVYVCDKSSWWIFHWQIAIGMVGVIILILILAACCCQCCVNKNHRRQRQMVAERRRPGRSRGRNNDEQVPRPPSFFSPEHPFAFTPPEYDSLPKDPPSYIELAGQDNPAFLHPPNDSLGDMTRSASLPSYTSHVENGNTDPRRPSDATLPPYSSQNISTTTTPNGSRRSSVQSGIILNFSRHSSRQSGRVLSPQALLQATMAPTKEKEEIDAPNGQQSAGQGALEGQQNTLSVDQTPSSSGAHITTAENVANSTGSTAEAVPQEHHAEPENLSQNTLASSEQSCSVVGNFVEQCNTQNIAL